MEKNFGSIADLTRLPSAVFVVDINKEHIAVAEARRLNIPTFAMVDTNTNPDLIDFPIPANDDASKSITIIVKYMCDAIKEGLSERKMDKDARDAAEEVEEKNERLAAELLDDEVDETKKGESKVKKVKAVTEDTDKRPRKPIAKKK